ncbi:MAG: uridine monophosphate kinase [Cloacibacillus evryensis]
MERKYNRVLLKLSGEYWPATLISASTMRPYADIEQIVEVAGEVSHFDGRRRRNIIRGAQTTSISKPTTWDARTVINSRLRDALERLGQPTRVRSAIEMRQIAETVIRRRATRHLEKGRIVIFAAGTGSPYFSTDTTAALRASEIGADCLLKATKVDGIYDKDPAKFTGAVKMPHVSYMDALQMQLKVMDAAAFSLCQENKIPIVVFDVLKKGNLRRLLIDGENIGSMVS